jgi:tRNA dimethylallyltransferase
LDVVDPKKQFTVIEFKRLAAQAILDIVSRGKLPIICGGTGFYIDTLLNDEDLPKVEADMELRKKLSDKTVDQLFEMLLKLDPERARGMNESDNKNPRRLIRAVEVAIATAVKSTTSSLVRIKKSGRQQLACTDQVVDKSTSQFARVQLSPKIEYTPIIIGLQLPNEQLRQRIGNRLLRRINAGMINEARKLHKSIPVGGAGVSWKRMEELGLEYRYMARYLQGKITKDEMTKQLETEIWHYAKRQMTWFKRNEKIKWFEAGQVIDIEKYYTQIFLSKRA